MRFSALFLAASATLAAAHEWEHKCAVAGTCLKITSFYAIEPLNSTSIDHAAVEFNVLNDNPQFGASSECEADWQSGTQNWPKQRKECSVSEFNFYVNGFSAIDKDFVIEATHAYKDPSVAGPPVAGVAVQDIVTNFARGNVTQEVITCEKFGSSYKFCFLKPNTEILLPIYGKTA